MRARNINFRQTKSERSGTESYRNFGKYLTEKYKKLRGKNYGKS